MSSETMNQMKQECSTLKEKRIALEKQQRNFSEQLDDVEKEMSVLKKMKSLSDSRKRECLQKLEQERSILKKCISDYTTLLKEISDEESRKSILLRDLEEQLEEDLEEFRKKKQEEAVKIYNRYRYYSDILDEKRCGVNSLPDREYGERCVELRYLRKKCFEHFSKAAKTCKETHPDEYDQCSNWIDSMKDCLCNMYDYDYVSDDIWRETCHQYRESQEDWEKSLRHMVLYPDEDEE